MALGSGVIGGDAVTFVQQHQKHRLGQYPRGNAPKRLGLAAGQSVGTVLRQTARRLGIVQADLVLHCL